MKLKYLTIFFFIALIIILTPSLAHAAWWNPLTWLDTATAAALSIVTYIITHIAAFIVGWVLRFSSFFLEWAINPGIGSITGQPFVASGVLITRSIANLMLIAILLIISIATIIGIESYGIRKALPMLIGVALLINFSSVVTGLVIDAGQVPLEFFTEKAFPSDFSIGKAFQKSLHLDDISISNFNIIGADEGFSEQFTTANVASNFIISIIVIIIGLMASFMFFKLGILLLLRYVAFWILTILAPFVFAISVFPSTRKYLTKWFTHLLEWSFLGVIATFFIYLALLVLVSFDISSSAIFKENIGKGGSFMGNFGITLISLFTVYFFLQYGYNISKKMAGEGAMAIVNGIGNLVKSGALMAAAGGLGAGALLGKGALKKGIGMFVTQKEGENKTRAERGEGKMRDWGSYLQTNKVFSRIGGNRVGQFMMGEQGFSEKELKDIAAKKTAWKIRVEKIQNNSSLSSEDKKEEINKLLESKMIGRTDKAALSYIAIEKNMLNKKGAVLANKLAKFDEKLNIKMQEKYGHIVSAIDASGNIDTIKMNKYLEENRNDISKLDLTAFDLDNENDARVVDNLMMKTDGRTLSDMNIRNPESVKKIQSRVEMIESSPEKKSNMIENISKDTGKEYNEIINIIDSINTQNSEMGPTLGFSKRVVDRVKEKREKKVADEKARIKSKEKSIWERV